MVKALLRTVEEWVAHDRFEEPGSAYEDVSEATGCTGEGRTRLDPVRGVPRSSLPRGATTSQGSVHKGLEGSVGIRRGPTCVVECSGVVEPLGPALEKRSGRGLVEVIH